MFMRKSFCTLASVLLVGFLVAGCAGPEQKLGRGMRNLYEVVRGGEMRRAKEQSALFDSPDEAYTTGFVKGFNRTMARTGLGLYEIVTSPFPPYDPVCTSYLKPNPVYPDNYRPRLKSDSTFATDTSLGFSGGDVAPLIPGSRFHIFDN